MSLFITSLNSGSNGNCYYIGNEQEAVLVDAGISCRETEIRMRRLGLSLSKVKAIFISHEHSDHISGLPVLAKKYNLPVYITVETLRHCRFRLEKHLVFPFRSYDTITIGGLSVTGFPKLHDASDPHSFIVTGNGVTVGIFTDIGKACGDVVTHFRQCHAAFLEANYDEQMLSGGRYPYYLKQRISSDHGHLSNDQALSLFREHRPAGMSHLLLAHLSKDNNCPGLAHKLFSNHAEGTEIVVASRYEETPVFRVTPGMVNARPAPVYEGAKQAQLSLF